jgi:signal transduction histidine kinase
MRRPSQLAPRSWLRMPARTARLRLTLLYGALFLASGASLLTVTYVLVSRTTANSFYFTGLGHQPAIAASVHNGKTTTQHTPGQESATEPTGSRATTSAHPQPNLQQANQALAQARHQHTSDLHHLLIWSAIALAVMAIISIALGYYVAGRVLKPLRRITTTARAISASSLHERLALTGPDDEFKALGDTLDSLLARLQTAFDAQRHFVANASHELRTPLAWEQTLLQVALADPNASHADLRETCNKVLAASKQQQTLVEALLTLATSERGLDHREPVSLAALVDTVLLARRPQAEDHGVEMTATVEPACTSGHPALIERLISNLIDNAIRYNHPAGHVHVHTTTANGRALLSVANSGPQVPPLEVERLFEPFRRLTTRRTNGGNAGHGLGLSIVKAIATAHQGQLTAHAQPDGGLTVQVALPQTSRKPEATSETPSTATVSPRTNPKKNGSDP